MIDMAALRDDAYAREHWTTLRPFYCRLTPEYIWQHVRLHILEELNEEAQANATKQWRYATYFTYPSLEQMTALHEAARRTGLFFSEIREIVGYRSAEALAVLAGLCRLESDGNVRAQLEESFSNLWQSFSDVDYGHGYDTTETRSDLVLILASNNVFGLVQDHGWIDRMRHYFRTDKHPWYGHPLIGSHGHVLRALGERDVATPAGNEGVMVEGVYDLGSGVHTLEALRDALLWEQGPPEDFDHSQPPSIFYRLPYHLMKFVGIDWIEAAATGTHDPFTRAVAHFLASLCLRSRVIDRVGIGRDFSLTHGADACGGDTYAARMTIGQMIKVGLVDFEIGQPWFSDAQSYRCTEQARALL
jgi:hypothetical protein